MPESKVILNPTSFNERWIMRRKIIILTTLFFLPLFVGAQIIDSDSDGLVDDAEIQTYHTSPTNSDTDNDGYADKTELDNGYSPHHGLDWKLSQLDWDQDGLSDDLEIKFGTDLNNADSDNDGFTDGEEVAKGFDPLNALPAKLPKKIEINLSEQKLTYFLNNVALGNFSISSGVNSYKTPTGDFQIYNKFPKAWSKLAGLWMPYWMAFMPNGRFGIHELPYWPNGYREGADHLGKPASHGCVRLGIGSAEFLYNWAAIGTPVKIFQ